jgi:hypothetical protein
MASQDLTGVKRRPDAVWFVLLGAVVIHLLVGLIDEHTITLRPLGPLVTFASLAWLVTLVIGGVSLASSGARSASAWACVFASIGGLGLIWM